MVRIFQYFFFISMLLLVSCGGQDAVEKQIANTDLQPDFNRFEKDLFANSLKGESVNVESLRKKYGAFFDLFTYQILNIPEGPDSSVAGNLQLFVTDPEIKDVYHAIDSVYHDTEKLESELTSFLKHYHYYYPDKPVPGIVTFLSAFNYAVITTDSLIGVGLDMFLGSDYPVYPRLGIPMYMSAKFGSEYIAPSVVKGWFQSDYPQEEIPKEFLNQIVYQGKMLYYIDKMLPQMHDSLKTGYSSEQLKWCDENETRIWSFFIEKKLLFSTDQSEYAKFINEGPSSNGFPKEAPARIGSWVGWKIVKKYMEEESDVSLIELLDEKDALKILEKSGYKPQR